MEDTVSPDRPPVRIGLGDGLVLREGRRIAMPAREFQLGATLALAGRPVAAESLLELLWPDSDTSRARACLKVHVHRIRVRLGSRSALVSVSDRWALGTEIGTDLQHWRRLANGRRPNLDSQRAALAHAFEEILAGPAPVLARSFLGSRLDAEFADVFERIGGILIDDAFACHDMARAAALARSAIAVDPYRDRWHEALIRAHVERGEYIAAHSILTSYAQTLRSELGVSVPKGIEALVTRAAAANAR
jgi:DNA-binding SARP family transcriptional activator